MTELKIQGEKTLLLKDYRETEFLGIVRDKRKKVYFQHYVSDDSKLSIQESWQIGMVREAGH